jgi:uncharacterized protein with von Willebrand factor type A (vWA) domain
MFLNFFLFLKSSGLPVTLKEYLTFLQALDLEVANYSVDDFYALSRIIFVKHEKHLDLFDRLFGHYFKGMEFIPPEFFAQIPKSWLEKKFIRDLSEEEKAMIEALGGPEKLAERFKRLLREQKERHQGGNKWIGTGGTSPFGAYGYNPEGYRIGQEESRHRRAIKVWDKREFRNLDDNIEINTRNMKLALKRLRLLTREGAATELDLEETIRRTGKNAGLLDLAFVPAKQNRVKVLLLLDIGGSMDDYIRVCAELFSAARYEFKHLEYFYFHNCVYESLWKDNAHRQERIPTWEVLHKFNSDYKLIIVGDAAMSPYEILYEGASVEHYNPEAGWVWLQRLRQTYPSAVWLNPMPSENWQYYQSVQIIQQLFPMFALTLEGLTAAMNRLKAGPTTINPQVNA